MSSPIKLVVFAIAQVLITAWLTYFFVTSEYRDLSAKSLQTLEQFLLSQKQQELKNYLSISISTVPQVEQGTEPSAEQKGLVADTFNRMLYSGDDGYFFVYTGDGTGVTHPKEPFRVGRNYYDLEDENGNRVIKQLIDTAKSGGGFYRYIWSKPSTQEQSEKLSYSVYLENWDWMVGTGLYLDDINGQLALLQSKLDTHISSTRSVILMVAMSSILFIFIFAAINHLRHKRQTDLKISALSQRVITMQEEERRHISRELHDGIVQIMVSIKYAIEATTMHLQKKDSGHPPQPLLLAQHNLDIAISEIRRISHHLHPKILDELGLGEALQNLAADFTKRTGVKVTTSKLSVSKLLPDEITTTLYRVAQESLINIEKHAQASQVKMTLHMANGFLTLTIKDDGKGFDTDKIYSNSKAGIGLRNLQERIEYHSGQFSADSGRSGTTVIAKIPKEKFQHHYHNKINN